MDHYVCDIRRSPLHHVPALSYWYITHPPQEGLEPMDALSLSDISDSDDVEVTSCQAMDQVLTVFLVASNVTLTSLTARFG